jgi:UDP-glucose 4-epimerase
MKNILITGGFGYLGSRLATYLNCKGYNIFLGTRNLNYKNSWDSGFNIKLINWESEKSINESCNNMDIVIHAAGTNAFDSQMNPVTALQVNGINTGKLMQASILHFVKQFIYISTAHVYDSPLVGFINEDSCLKNQHPYATSHRAGEDVVNSLAKNKEIDLKILRLSNSFGFPVHKDVDAWMLIVNDVCKQLIINNGLVKLSSSGKQQRDFIPIENVNIIISKMIEFPKLFQGNSIFNIGSGQSMSILDITKIICERYQLLFNSEYQIVVDNSKELPSQFLEFNCDRIKHIIKDLSEHFLYEIDETLIFVYKHFNN